MSFWTCNNTPPFFNARYGVPPAGHTNEQPSCMHRLPMDNTDGVSGNTRASTLSPNSELLVKAIISDEAVAKVICSRGLAGRHLSLLALVSEIKSQAQPVSNSHNSLASFRLKQIAGIAEEGVSPFVALQSSTSVTLIGGCWASKTECTVSKEPSCNESPAQRHNSPIL